LVFKIIDAVKRVNPSQKVLYGGWYLQGCYHPLGALLVDRCPAAEFLLLIHDTSRLMVKMIRGWLKLEDDWIVGFVHGFDRRPLMNAQDDVYRMGYRVAKVVYRRLMSEGFEFVPGDGNY
jgi:hypothetical protein